MSQQLRYPNSAAVTISSSGTNGAPIPTSSMLIGGDGPTHTLIPIAVDASGFLKLSYLPALSFIKNSVLQTVIEDTVTPANNAPLPVKLTGVSGDVNITAGDLNVEISAAGANYSSIRIGDGTTLLGITVSNEAKVSDATAQSSLSSIDGKITACDTGNVTVVGSALPTGAATESTLATLDGKVTACNTGAVTISSSALPTGAATESTLLSIDGKITACNTGAVTVSSSALPTGAATETTLSAIDLKIGGKVDANNSSAIALGIGGVFTGTATDVTNAAGVMISVFSNVSSAASGVSLQFSSDGTNWDETVTQTFTAGTNALTVVTSVRAKFFRIVYTNGGVGQTSFRLQTIIKDAALTGDILELTDNVNRDAHATMCRSGLFGRDTTGSTTYREVLVDTSNRLVTAVGTSALPTGAATSANQTTANNSLTSIDGKLPAALGAQTMAGSLSVTMASNQTAFPVSATTVSAPSGRIKANAPTYLSYSSTNVTTAAYTQLIASTSGTANLIEIFDSSGQAMILAVGGAGSEVDQLFIFPGGQGQIPIAIVAGSRISIKAQTGTANSGYILLNLYS